MKALPQKSERPGAEDTGALGTNNTRKSTVSRAKRTSPTHLPQPSRPSNRLADLAMRFLEYSRRRGLTKDEKRIRKVSAVLILAHFEAPELTQGQAKQNGGAL